MFKLFLVLVFILSLFVTIEAARGKSEVKQPKKVGKGKKV